VKPLSLDEILDLDTYERIRPEYRERIIAHKNARRVGVGDRVTLVFEDRETLRYQIQEMTRIEKTRDPDRVRDELDVYNELVPGDGELSATLFIEIPELSEVRSELDRLLGIDEHVFLVLDEAERESLVRARFDERQMEEDRISAVHYLRFTLDEVQVGEFARSPRLRIRIDHPKYRAEAEIGDAMRESLLRDLYGEPASLVDERWLEGAPGREPELLFESERARVVRPLRTAAAEHVRVEPRAPLHSAVEVDAALLAELWTLVQRFAGEIESRVGASRVLAEVGRGRPLRFEVLGEPPRRGH